MKRSWDTSESTKYVDVKQDLVWKLYIHLFLLYASQDLLTLLEILWL